MIWTETFPMDPQQFAAAKGKLQAAGVTVDDAAGKLTHGNIVAGYDFDGTQVKVELLACPFLERGIVEGKIRDWFKA